MADFCEEFGSLAYYSTQAGESSHSDFKKTLKNYFTHEITDKELFAKNLLAAVIKYNSKHVQNGMKL